MACRVKLNKDGSVISVERPDGSPSTLYPEALRFHEDEEKALEMVAYQELEDFNNVVNYEVEPTLKQVLNYIHYKNAKASKVSPDDILHITDFMAQADVNTIEELDDLLHNMFRPEGYFQPDVSKMVNSGIYTQVEAENLLTNDKALDSLISMIEKVSGMQLRDEALETNNVSLEQKLKDTSELTPFGTYTTINDYTIEQEIVEATKGVDSFDQFKKNIMSLNVPHIVQQILEDDTFAFELFSKYKNYKEVRSAFITDNQLVAREDGHYEETLKGTILQGQDNTNLLDKIGTFMGVSTETKLTAMDATIQLVKEIEKEAANLNIDVIGLHQQSLENITVMLNALAQLTEDAKVDGLNVIKVENFADIHQSIFNPEGKSEVKYELLTKNLQNKKLIRLNTEVSNEVVFEEFGLLKVGDNLYHHLSKDMTVDDLYDELYNKILRKERPSPTKIPDINDPFNKPEVLENLKSYINRLRYHSEIRNPQLRERATLLSVLFNHPIESKVEEEVRDLVNITTSEQYLKTDFISDFYNYYLKEKLKDSKLYRDVLSNFEFNNKDLTIKENSLEFLNRYRAVSSRIPLKEALEDYARLKKGDSIRAIAPTKETTKVITDMGRFVNNPQLLDDYNRPVEVVGDYLTADTSDNFIKYNDTVYMRVGAGVFMSLPNNPNKTYYTLDYKVSPDQSTINLLERQAEPSFQFMNYEDFQDNIFNVSDPKFDNMVVQLEAVQDPNVRSTFRITEGDSVLNFSFKFGRVELDMIETPKGSRGKGQARALMQRFTEALDAHSLESNLFIQPRDKETTAEGLQAFYESFGYIEGEIETSMDRSPRRRTPGLGIQKQTPRHVSLQERGLIKDSDRFFLPTTEEQVESFQDQIENIYENIDKYDEARLELLNYKPMSKEKARENFSLFFGLTGMVIKEEESPLNDGTTVFRAYTKEDSENWVTQGSTVEQIQERVISTKEFWNGIEKTVLEKAGLKEVPDKAKANMISHLLRNYEDAKSKKREKNNPVLPQTGNDIVNMTIEDIYPEETNSHLYESNIFSDKKYITTSGQSLSVIFRGVHSSELEFIKNNGYIESAQEYNLGDEVDVRATVYGKTPKTAHNYAYGFTPQQFKPTEGNPNYILMVDNNPNLNAVTDVLDGYVKIVKPVSSNNIIGIFSVDENGAVKNVTEQLLPEVTKNTKEVSQTITPALLTKSLVESITKGAINVELNTDKSARRFDQLQKLGRIKKGVDFRNLNGFADGFTAHVMNQNPNTLIHEAGHIWYMSAKVQNPEILTKAEKDIKGTAYYTNLDKSSIYKDMSDDKKVEEALIQMIGDKGAQLLEDRRSKNLRTWLNNFWEFIKESLGLSEYVGSVQDLTLEEFAELAAVDIIKGNVFTVVEGATAFGFQGMDIPSRSQISVGAMVTIEDRRSRGDLIDGEVAEILTRSETHPYGILVRLTDGKEGRVKMLTTEEEIVEPQVIETPSIDQLEVGDFVDGVTFISGTIKEGQIAQVLGVSKYGDGRARAEGRKTPIVQFTDGRILEVQRVFKNETRPKSEEYLMKENIMKTINRLSPIQDNVITYSEYLANNPYSGRGRINISYYNTLEDLYKIEEFVNEITENEDHKKIFKTALEYGGIISLGTINNYEIAIGDTSDYYSVTIDYYNGTFSTRNRETNRESYDVKPGSVVTAIKKAADKYNTMPASTRDKEGFKAKRAQENRNKKGLSSLTEAEVNKYRRQVPYLNPALAKLIDNKGTADNIVRVFPTESKWYPIIKQISEYKELKDISLDFLPRTAYQAGTYKPGQGKAPAEHLIDVQKLVGEDTLVHELIHGVSHQELRFVGHGTGQTYLDSLDKYVEDNLGSESKAKAAVARLVELYLEAAEKVGKMDVLKKYANVPLKKAPRELLGDNYGFLNIDEFITESFSNIRFQEKLNSIESDKVTGQTLLGRFIQLISDLLNSFGKTQLVDGNILKEVILVSETIFEASPSDMAYDFTKKSTEKASNVFSQMNNPITVENLLTQEEENSIETCR